MIQSSAQPQKPQTLAQWIDARMSDADAARELGISKSHLSLILKGQRGISLELAAKIETLTGGEFTALRLHQEQRGRDEPAGADQ